MSDPWDFQVWAFKTTTGNSIRKAVLMALATMAATESGRCEAKLTTIAEWVETTKPTVSRHLAALETAGIIEVRPQYRINGSRRGNEYLLLAPWVTEWPDGAPLSDRQGGRGSRLDTPTQVSEQGGPELPPRNGHFSETGSENLSSKSARVKRQEVAQALPPNFPDELKPHARIVFVRLRGIAEQHNARVVTPHAVGCAIMGNPGRRYVKEVYALEAWAQAPPRPIKDIVSTYRSWLDRSESFAGIEHLNGDRPAVTNGSGNGHKYDGEFEAMERLAGLR